jgi:hypothetical protein
VEGVAKADAIVSLHHASVLRDPDEWAARYCCQF